MSLGEIEALVPVAATSGTLLRNVDDGVSYVIQGAVKSVIGNTGTVTVPGRYLYAYPDGDNHPAVAAYNQVSGNFEVYYNSGGNLTEKWWNATSGWGGPTTLDTGMS